MNKGAINPTVLTGLESCLASPPDILQGARLGLLMNQASVDSRFCYACDLIAEKFRGQFKVIFSPQHGLWTEEQANMIESGHQRYAPLVLPVYSLYSETRAPEPEMLDQIDVLIIDLQDVGTRVYTFIWTMRECLKSCEQAGKSLVILDRPNPIGGAVVEGPMLEPDFRSFVGEACIPLRHGLTIAELALLFQREEFPEVDLHVVPMQSWQRNMLFPETGLPWVAPSPNMPRFETAAVYPGQVLLEGANLSEGRGTTLPFELCGAPYLDEREFVQALNRYDFPGIALRPVRFRPTFDKWKGEICRGVAIHMTEPNQVRSVELTLAILATSAAQAPQEFRWLDPPYEYEYIKPPIDILFGSEQLRDAISQGTIQGRHDLERLSSFDESSWHHRCAPCLLY